MENIKIVEHMEDLTLLKQDQHGFCKSKSCLTDLEESFGLLSHSPVLIPGWNRLSQLVCAIFSAGLGLATAQHRAKGIDSSYSGEHGSDPNGVVGICTTKLAVQI